jgi:hypothetical protein
MNESMVAILGSIMPAPLAKPTIGGSGAQGSNAGNNLVQRQLWPNPPGGADKYFLRLAPDGLGGFGGHIVRGHHTCGTSAGVCYPPIEHDGPRHTMLQVFPAHFDGRGTDLVRGEYPGGSGRLVGEDQRHVLGAPGFNPGGDSGAFKAFRQF